MSTRVRLNDGNRRWWTLAAMCFALFMIMLDNTVVNVALPSIQRDLGTSLSGLEWTVNAYTLSFAVLLVTGGRLGDIYGRRRMFLFGVVLFALASAAIGFSPGDGWLVAGRLVQGVGAAFMMPGTLSIITNAFPPAERGKAIGTWAGVSALALAIGPVVGGALTEYVSWRAIFFLNLPVAVGAVVVTLFAAQESRDETVARRVDVPGIAVLSAGLTALVLALVESGQWGWGSPGIVGLLLAAVVGLVGFAALEPRVRTPMVDFAFFRSRTFFGANAAALVVSFAMFAMFFFIALYMQGILDYSPVQAGVRFLPSTLMVIVTAPIAGRLADRIGSRPLMTVGLTVVAFALFLLTRIDSSTTYGDLLPAFVLMGFGLALTISPMSTAAMNSVSQDKAGVASGILSMTRMVGGTLGVAALGALFQHLASNRLDHTLAGTGLSAAQRDQIAHNLGSAHPVASTGASPELAAQVGRAGRDAFVHALSGGMWLCTGVALVGALAAFVLVGRKPSSAEAEPAGEVPSANGHRPAARRALSRAFHLPEGLSRGTRPVPGAAPPSLSPRPRPGSASRSTPGRR
jgi:EmrB/QacA subfamily drug resistance transporter